MKFKDPPTMYPDGPLSYENAVNTAARWESETGLWRLDVNAVLFGWRLNLARRSGFASAPWLGYELDYCMGTNSMTMLLLPRAVLRILDRFDEHRPAEEVCAIFPLQKRKPMHNDPECWREICRLAGISDALELTATAAEIGAAPLATLRAHVGL